VERPFQLDLGFIRDAQHCEKVPTGIMEDGGVGTGGVDAQLAGEVVLCDQHSALRLGSQWRCHREGETLQSFSVMMMSLTSFFIVPFRNRTDHAVRLVRPSQPVR
jgi:hypothetical protein